MKCPDQDQYICIAEDISMSSEDLLPTGEKLRKAVVWISEMCMEHPEKTRKEIIFEAERTFDLSPKECDFLNRKFLCPEKT